MQPYRLQEDFCAKHTPEIDILVEYFKDHLEQSKKKIKNELHQI